MKFDLHCHTKEGSVDSKVTIQEYITRYRELGYDGFMITDHNSYKGCLAWHLMHAIHKYGNTDGFTVLCGIEYDTKDAGHVLVVLPDGIYLPILRIRGMRARKLAKIVHRYGGIVGLAHPFGIPSSSAMSFKLMNESILKQMDFIEVFNTCENEVSNKLAGELAEKYRLPGFAGTDAHNAQFIGMAATEIEWDIHSNRDLIDAVNAGASFITAGTEREVTLKGRAKEMWFSQLGYKIYNRGLGKIKMPRRKYMTRKLNNGHKPLSFKKAE